MKDLRLPPLLGSFEMPRNVTMFFDKMICASIFTT
jgi:hypothetical protein